MMTRIFRTRSFRASAFTASTCDRSKDAFPVLISQ